jgi:hypothetical protein
VTASAAGEFEAEGVSIKLQGTRERVLERLHESALGVLVT